MSYQRKLEDNRRLKKLREKINNWWPAGAYIKTSDSKSYYKRYWKSEGKKSLWAWAKKQAHKACRKFLKENDYYTKKAYDLWWIVW